MKVENILLIISAIFYGVGAFLGKIALKDLSPFNVYLQEALGVLTIAALTILVYRSEFASIPSSLSWPGYLFGVLWGLGTVTLIFALKNTSASVAISLNSSLYPLVTVLLAITFLKEVITFKIGLGIIFAILATLLLI